MSRNSGEPRRMLRRFALGSGPLKRGSDRLQVLARILVLITLLTAVPIALAVATAAYSQGRTVAAAEAAGRHQVRAELLVDAKWPDDAGYSDPYSDPLVMDSTVAWTAPSGVARTGVVAVPEGAKAGSSVPIWIDGKGDVKIRPATPGDAAGEALGAGLLTFMAFALVAAATYLPFRMLLDRSRLRRWAAGWAVVEPVWSRKVP
jgi:hypothetical protein